MCLNIWKFIPFLSRCLFLGTSCRFQKKQRTFSIWEKLPFSAEGAELWEITSNPGLCTLDTVSCKKRYWPSLHGRVVSVQYGNTSERWYISPPPRGCLQDRMPPRWDGMDLGVSWLSASARAPRPACLMRQSHLIPRTKGPHQSGQSPAGKSWPYRK